MTVFTATFSGVTIATAGGTQDLFEIVAPATSRVIIHDIALAQYSPSDLVDAEAEIVSLLIMRGHTTSGSGGSTPTASNMNPYSRAAGSVVETNNTTLASSGSPETLWADGWHLQAGFIWRLSERTTSLKTEGKILLKPSQRLVVRMASAVADDIVGANGTLLFEEIGKAPI